MPLEGKAQMELKSPEYGYLNRPSNGEIDSVNSVMRHKPISCFTPANETNPTFQSQNLNEKLTMPKSQLASTDEYALIAGAMRSESIQSNENKPITNGFALGRIKQTRNKLTGGALSQNFNNELNDENGMHIAPSHRGDYNSSRLNKALISQSPYKAPIGDRPYPGSGYTSVLGQYNPLTQSPDLGAKDPADISNHAQNPLNVNVGISRTNAQNLNLCNNTMSLSPGKKNNSISQNGQMILNLNSNVIQSLVRSSNNNNNNFTQQATGEFFKIPHRKSVLSAHVEDGAVEKHHFERNVNKQSLSPSFRESSMQDRTKQALLSKNLPHHHTRINHFQHIQGTKSIKQNRQTTQTNSPTKQILIENGLSLGLGLNGASSHIQQPLFGIQDMHASQPKESTAKFGRDHRNQV